MSNKQTIAPHPTPKQGSEFVVPNLPNRDFAYEVTLHDVIPLIYDYEDCKWRDFGVISKVQEQVVRDLLAAQNELVRLQLILATSNLPPYPCKPTHTHKYLITPKE